jgi:hypothetical protein
MAYTKDYTIDPNPSGDTVKGAIDKCDDNIDGLFTDLNAHEALTTNAHGFTGAKTGSGAMVGATSPTLVTPILGVAAATSINKVALTAPATGSTITIADGKTLTCSNTLNLAGTDGETLTVNDSITLPTVTSGGLLYGSAANVVGDLAKGTASQKLQMKSDASTLEWVDGEMPWSDYSSSSAITGWSSLSTRLIWYKKTGKKVLVAFYLNGTSNGDMVVFTVPYTAVSTGVYWGGTLLGANDNSAEITAACRCILNGADNHVACFTNMGGGVWTASGTKAVLGSFEYITT